MNTSAKLTALSFLAASALGAAAFMGCTTTSSTVDDTDGGTTTHHDSGSTSDTGTNADTGTGATACTSSKQPQNTTLGSNDCQTCLEGKCCTELTTCFDIADDADAGGMFGCAKYVDCIDECKNKPEAEQQDCIENTDTGCNAFAKPGVVDAYNAILTCGEKTENCKAQCGL